MDPEDELYDTKRQYLGTLVGYVTAYVTKGILLLLSFAITNNVNTEKTKKKRTSLFGK